MRSSARFESAISSSSSGPRPDHSERRCPSTSASSARETTKLNNADPAALPRAPTADFGGLVLGAAGVALIGKLCALAARAPLPLAGRGRGWGYQALLRWCPSRLRYSL